MMRIAAGYAGYDGNTPLPTVTVTRSGQTVTVAAHFANHIYVDPETDETWFQDSSINVFLAESSQSVSTSQNDSDLLAEASADLGAGTTYRGGYQFFNTTTDDISAFGEAFDFGVTLFTDIADFRGGSRPDVVFGSGLADNLHGGAGDDAIDGAAGTDNLIGGLGDDSLYGGSGVDRMEGGVGDDLFRADHVDDAVYETATGGRDTVETSVSYTMDLHVEVGHVIGGAAVALTGTAGANHMTGNDAINTLTGLGGADYLSGRGGADVLRGGDGADTLKGGDGADRLMGGTGRDVLTGGTGADVFVFTQGDGRDLVTFFDATGAVHDRVDLRDTVSINGFADLKANHLKVVNGNVVIDALAGDVLTLDGAKLADLDSRDFLF